MNSQAIFVEAVLAMGSLPAPLREHAGDVTGLKDGIFDKSYIEFLDTQIEWNPRGPEWTARLVRRRAGLRPFCGIALLSGRVQAGDSHFTVYVDPETRDVVHWEEYSTSALEH